MSLKIGKQSTVNDLEDLQKDLEAKISAAAAIKVGDVAQIEQGLISSGLIFSEKPTGVYKVNAGTDMQTYGAGNGLLLHMQDSGNAGLSAQIYAKFTNKIFFGMRNYTSGAEYVSCEMLTTANTITDANGFIKAA